MCSNSSAVIRPKIQQIQAMDRTPELLKRMVFHALTLSCDIHNQIVVWLRCALNTQRWTQVTEARITYWPLSTYLMHSQFTTQVFYHLSTCLPVIH